MPTRAKVAGGVAAGDQIEWLSDRCLQGASVRVEVVRAVRPHGEAAVLRARGILQGLFLLRLDDALLEEAGSLESVLLRSLDAIHLAAARSVSDSISAFVTYDVRQAGAAKQVGLTIIAPGARV